MDKSSSARQESTPAAHPQYEAPKIETIVTPGEFEREVHYAGQPLSIKR